MIHWQSVAQQIANGEVSKDDYSAQIHIPFKNPLNKGQIISQVVPLSEAEFKGQGNSLFLTFIPKMLTYYSCGYNRVFSPIELSLVDKLKNKTSLIDDYSTFFVPGNQNEDGVLRFTNLSLRLQGFIAPLTRSEWNQLELQQQTEMKVLFSSSPPSISYDGDSRQIGIVGALKKLIIKLNF